MSISTEKINTNHNNASFYLIKPDNNIVLNNYTVVEDPREQSEYYLYRNKENELYREYSFEPVVLVQISKPEKSLYKLQNKTNKQEYFVLSNTQLYELNKINPEQKPEQSSVIIRQNSFSTNNNSFGNLKRQNSYSNFNRQNSNITAKSSFSIRSITNEEIDDAKYENDISNNSIISNKYLNIQTTDLIKKRAYYLIRAESNDEFNEYTFEPVLFIEIINDENDEDSQEKHYKLINLKKKTINIFFVSTEKSPLYSLNSTYNTIDKHSKQKLFNQYKNKIANCNKSIISVFKNLTSTAKNKIKDTFENLDISSFGIEGYEGVDLTDFQDFIMYRDCTVYLGGSRKTVKHKKQKKRITKHII